MFYKDRAFEGFRSLYAQRPTQSSVLRRNFVFSAEEAEYAGISRIASHDYSKLTQEGIDVCIPGISAQSVNTSSSYPNLCIAFTGGEWLPIFDLADDVFFYAPKK